MKTLLEKLSAIRLVPVVVIHDADKAVPLAKALLDNGCAEYSPEVSGWRLQVATAHETALVPLYERT